VCIVLYKKFKLIWRNIFLIYNRLIINFKLKILPYVKRMKNNITSHFYNNMMDLIGKIHHAEKNAFSS